MKTIKRIASIFLGFFSTWGRATLNAPANRGFRTTDEVFKKRIQICQACPQYNPAVDLCSACFCIMDVKARLTIASCPEDKW